MSFPDSTPNGGAYIDVAGLSMIYGGEPAVDDVSLQVAGGEVVSIIGPSGAGKSTFLRSLNLLEIPTRGYMRIGSNEVLLGADQRRLKQAEINTFRRGTGMVFQNFNLFPHLTAIRNISLAQERVLGRSRSEAHEVSMKLLERVGLSDKAQAFPGRCSGGQQQRIAIARALALDPSAILFDEPTSALDPEVGAEVLAVMRELASEGMTMLVVTHEIGFARNVSDRVVVMVDGRIIEQGEPPHILNAPEKERTARFLNAVMGR